VGRAPFRVEGEEMEQGRSTDSDPGRRYDDNSHLFAKLDSEREKPGRACILTPGPPTSPLGSGCATWSEKEHSKLLFEIILRNGLENVRLENKTKKEPSQSRHQLLS